MRFSVDTANPGETKESLRDGVINGITTKRVVGGLEEGSREMERGLF